MQHLVQAVLEAVHHSEALGGLAALRVAGILIGVIPHIVRNKALYIPNDALG